MLKVAVRSTLLALLCWILAPSVAAQRPLLLWQGILPYGLESPTNQEAAAFAELGAYLQTMDAWRARLYSPLQEKPYWLEFRERSQTLKGEQFLNQRASYIQHDGQRLSLHFSGAWQTPGNAENGYHFGLRRAPMPSMPLDPKTALGQIEGRLSFERGTLSSQNVLSALELRMNFGTLLFDEILRSIEQTNAVLQPDNLAQIELDARADPPAHRLLFERLHGFDQRLLRLFMQSIPHLMSVLTEVTYYEQIAAPERSPDGALVTRIATRQRIDSSKLKARYPDTWTDFKRLLNSASLDIRMQIDAEHHLWQIRYDAETQMFLIDLALDQGGYVLLRKDGSLSTQRILPTQLNTLDYQINSSLRMSLLGLDIRIEDLVMQARYLAHNPTPVKTSNIPWGAATAEPESLTSAPKGIPRLRREASLDLRMTEMPRIEVSGALLYILPKWLIDLLIPGTIETLIAESFDELVHGNHGHGLTVGLRFQEQEGRGQLKLQVLGELPYATLQQLLDPQEALESNVKKRLYRDLREKFRLDWARMALPVLQAPLDEYARKLLTDEALKDSAGR